MWPRNALPGPEFLRNYVAVEVRRRRMPSLPKCPDSAIQSAEAGRRFDRQLSTGEGGLPIKVGNDTIGGIAVAGAPGGDTDEACAREGLDKVKDQLSSSSSPALWPPMSPA